MAYNPNEPRDQAGKWSATPDPGSDYTLDKFLSLVKNDVNRIKDLSKAALRGSGFTIDEELALEAYADSSDQINNALRGKGPTTLEVKSQIAKIDSALSKSFTPHEIEVYRIVDQKYFDDKLRHRIGAQLVDRGFMSTTASVHSAREVMDAFNNVESDTTRSFKMMKLIVPRGHPAIFGVSTSEEDREILLKRGTRFKLLDRNNIQVLK